MKKLLTLLTLSCMALAMQAQGWVKPSITASDYSELKVSAPGDTTFYYLYNIDAEGFLTNYVTSHAQWSTHAAIGETGNRMFISRYEIDGEEWDGQTVYINNRYDSQWYSLFAASVTNSYVDYQSSGYPIWSMVNDGKVYKFSVSDSNTGLDAEMTELIGKSFMGLDIYDDDYLTNGRKPITPMIDVSEGEGEQAIHWAFIPEDVYTTYANKLSAYNAAVSLAAELEMMKEAYPGFDVASYEAVYNNTASTAAQLDEALKNLTHDLYDYRITTELQGATNTDPRDATSFIQNPDFETGNADGWSISIGSTSASGYQGDSYTNGDVSISNFIQAWRPTYNNTNNKLGDGRIYTSVRDLPAGKYKLECDAISVFRIDGGGAPKVEGVTFYVTNAADVDMSRPVATEDYMPEHYSMVFAMQEAGTIEFGLKARSCTASWIAADNFRLTYYGEVTDPKQAELDGLVAQYEEEFPDLEDVIASKAVKDAFTDEINKCKELTEGFEAEIEVLKAAYNAVLGSIEDYKLLKAALDECQEYMDNLAETFPELANELGDFQMDMESEYYDRSADSEYCQGASAMVHDKIMEEIAKNEKAGDEITAILVNPNFSKKDTGWTWNPKNAADVKQPASANPVITAYGTTFDIYQTVNGLKPGIYRVDVQGYYRTTSESDAYSEYVAGTSSEIIAELYLNNISGKLMNAFDDCTSTPLGSGSYQIPDGENEGKWVPASGADVSKAFGEDPDLYRNSVYGYVGDDGVLTIGVRQPSNPRNACYTAIDNFRLFYAGVNPEAVAKVVEKLQAEAEVLDEVVISQEARQNLDNAIQAVTDADEDGIIAAISNFFDTIEAGKVSAAKHEGLVDTYDKLAQAQEDYPDASAEKLAAVVAIQQEVVTAIEKGCETDDACSDLISRAGQAIVALKLPDGVATEDNPIDYSCLLVNPDLDQDSGNADKNVPGWDRGSCNGYKQNTFSAFGGASHLYQTVTGLPAGKYIIEAQGAYRAGDCAGDASRYAADPEGDKNAWVFGTTSEGTVIGYLHRNTEYALEENLGGSGSQTVTVDGKSLYVPFNTGAYVAWFEAGYYITRIEVIVPEDGELQLGIDKPNYVSNDYININYVHLFYCGAVSSTGNSDVNGDGTVDTQDVLAIYEYMQSAEGDKSLYDVNKDGIVDTQDVLKVYETIQANVKARK